MWSIFFELKVALPVADAVVHAATWSWRGGVDGLISFLPCLLDGECIEPSLRQAFSVLNGNGQKE